MNDAYIFASARSPMTRAARGGLAFTRIDDVAAEVARSMIGRISNFDLGLIEDVLVGCAMPEGEQGLNIARNISFLAGLPVSCAAVTINRFCASSMEALAGAVRAIWCGDGDLFLVGGVESMSHVPMGGFNPSLNEKLRGALMRGSMPDAYISMGLTAENVAREFKISREDQDKFALASHMKAVAAEENKKFDAEMVPISAVGSDGGIVKVSRDECPRADTSLEALSKLPPAFSEGGTVTAGNSSPLTDGAVMILAGSKALAKKLKVKPLAKIRGIAVAGVDPAFMGIGPVFSVPKVLKRAGLKLKDVGLIELNEAFAAQSLAVIRSLGFDEKIVNVNGGAIALGHPLGMSGARIVATLVHAMIDRSIRIGLATMCIGGGQGMAIAVELVR